VRQIARDVTRDPAVIVTEDLGKNPQEGMIGVEKKKAKRNRAEAPHQADALQKARKGC